MSKSDDAASKLLSFFVGLPLSFIVSWIIGGWVLSCMWSWFVIPLFGFAELTVFQASGLSMMTGALTGQYHQAISDNKVKEALGIDLGIFEVTILSVFTWLFLLLVAWVLHLFV